MAKLAEIPLMPVSSLKGRALAFFAGIWPPHACVLMKSKGWEEIEAFGSLKTDSANPVKTYHNKVMPVILTTEDEWDLWLSGETWDHVKSQERPLLDGTLKVVGVGPRSGDVAPVRNVGVGYRLCMGATRQPRSASLVACRAATLLARPLPGSGPSQVREGPKAATCSRRDKQRPNSDSIGSRAQRRIDRA